MKPWLLAPVLIALDQATKYVAREALLSNTMELFSGVRLQLAFNKGFAFSLPAPQLMLIALAIGVSVFLVYWSKDEVRTSFERWAAVLVASGAIGNAIDRILFTEVTDFLAFGSFPIFNVADICVSFGVGILLLGELRSFKK